MIDRRTGLFLVALLAACTGEPPAETSLRVHFVQPVNGQLLLADADEDGTNSSYQTTVELEASDTGGRALTLASATLEFRRQDGTWTVVSVPAEVSGGTARFPGITLPADQDELHAVVSESGSFRKAEAFISVTVQPPRPRVLSVSVVQDANHDFRLNTTELQSGAPTLVVGTFGMEDGQKVVVTRGATSVGQGVTAGGQASVSLTGLAGANEEDAVLVVRLTNASGNTNNVGAPELGYPTDTQATFTLRIDRVAPTVNVTYSTVDSGNPLYTLAVHVDGTLSSDVGAGGVDLVVSPPGGAHTIVGASGGVFSADLAGAVDPVNPANTVLTLVATDLAGNVSAAVNVPLVTLTKFFCNGNAAPAAGKLFVVANSNVHLFGQPYPTPEPGYLVDQTPGGNAQISCSVDVARAAGGSLRVTYNGAVVFGSVSFPGNAGTQTVALPMTLTHDTASNLVVEGTDALGNKAQMVVQATIDVQPPADPAPVASLVVSPSRQVQVDVTWSASGDDGNAGTVTGYDLRYRPQALFDEDNAAPSLTLLRLRDDTSFFHPTRSIRIGGGNLLAPTQLAASLTALPPWSDYSIGVRAVDEMGNSSSWVGDEHVVVASNAQTGVKVVANPDTPGVTGSTRFGWNLAAADFDGDGKADLAVGEPFDANSTGTVGSLASKVWVFKGQADLSASLGAPQQLGAPEGTVQRYGRDLSAGNVGDDASPAPALPDLLVSAWRAFSFNGRVLVYFGQSGVAGAPLDAALSPTTPHVIDFRGESGAGMLGFSAKVVPDFGAVGGGANDGLSEIMMSAPAMGSGKGRVYLFWGRSQAAWLALGSTDATSGTRAVPASLADVTFEGDPCPGAPVPSNCLFGNNHGFVNVGDVDSDGVPDIGIPQSNDTLNKLFVFSGALVRSTSGTATVLTPANALATLTQSAIASGGLTPNGSLEGFASEATLSPAMLGANPALVATIPLISRAVVYSSYGQSSASPLQILDSFYNRLRHLGTGLAAGDLDGDGKSDLLLGENVSSPGASVWLLLNTGNAAQPFDAAVGDGPHQSRLFGTLSLGASVVVGDFNGDSRLDFAAGDPEGAGQPGEVRIFY